MPRIPREAGRLQSQHWLPVPIPVGPASQPATIAMETMHYFVTVDSCALKIAVLEWHVREYLQPLVARAKVPRCRCHGAG